MTIATDPVLAATLLAAGEENNPFIAHLNKGADATATTALGTELTAASNATSGATYNFWSATPTVAGSARLQFVFGSDVVVNFVGIAAHNLGTIGATVKVSYSTDSGATWTDSAAGSVTPTDDQAIGFRFENVDVDYWRIAVTDAGTNDVVIGVALISKYLTIPQRIYQGYAPPITRTDVTLQSNVSEGGHLLGSSVTRRSSRAAASLDLISPTFFRGINWGNFQEKFNSGGGFFWAWRPDDYADDLFYAWRSGPPLTPTNAGPNELMAVEMNMRLYDEP